jgi:hypothetical protein
MGVFYLIKGNNMEFDLSKMINNPSVKQAQADVVRYDKGRPRGSDIYSSVSADLGIPDARAQLSRDRAAIENTNNLIEAVNPSVTGRTQGSLVTEAQRQGLVNKETAPLMAGLGKQTGAYNTSQGAFADLMGQAQLKAQLAIQDQDTIYNQLLQRLQYAQQAEAENAARRAAAQQNAAWTAMQEALARAQQEAAAGDGDRYSEWLGEAGLGSANVGNTSRKLKRQGYFANNKGTLDRKGTTKTYKDGKWSTSPSGATLNIGNTRSRLRF